MAYSKMAALLTVVAVALVASRTAEGQATCGTTLVSCSSYLNSSTMPTNSCCDPLRETVRKDLACLCNLYKTPGFLENLGINLTKALNLSRNCGLTGDLSVCSASAPTSPNDPPLTANKKMWIVIASTISLVLIFGSLGYLGMRKRKQKEKKRKQEEYVLELATSDNFDNANQSKKSGRKGHDIHIFNFGDIVAATNNFSNDNKLGEGGFGLVFKGKLSDEREIAIKRLSKTSGQGVLEFKNELILIAKLQHRNLVRVLGCCIHGEEKMLVYEYMPNKSLDSFLFDITKREQLDWKVRVNIIDGIVQGLLYLHKYSRMRVIHRDLKASNILLDEHMNPKISDFGMARIFMKDEIEAMTSRIVGTYGYMSPEYVMGGTFSMKFDVFSFGVLTIEIVSGRRNTSFYHLDKLFNLIGFAWMLWKEGEALQLKDPTLVLEDSHDVNNLLRTIHVGLLCVQENANSRPPMSDVIVMLSNETMPLPIPQKPAFFTQQDELEQALNDGTLTKCSINYMSISTLEARS